jgi:hypothetical protein
MSRLGRGRFVNAWTLAKPESIRLNMLPGGDERLGGKRQKAKGLDFVENT